MAGETVIVFKDKRSREIQTYVNMEGHGARVEVPHFVALLAEAYGSPATTMTRSTFAKRLLESMDEVILQMKASTVEVAAINLEPEKAPQVSSAPA